MQGGLGLVDSVGAFELERKWSRSHDGGCPSNLTTSLNKDEKVNREHYQGGTKLLF